ncbi:MAG: beta strand repeat-containing protein, partial [bacterium]
MSNGQQQGGRVEQMCSKDAANKWTVLLLFSVLISFLPNVLPAQTLPSTPVLLGFRDFEYTGGTSAITEEKPESKLWHHDGFWWAVLWDPATLVFRIHRFGTSPHGWTNVGPDVDDRQRSAADVLVDGNTLYIISRARTSIQASKSEVAILNRYTYDSISQTYTVDGGFPVQITGSTKSRAMTIAKDSNGKLWATWTNDTAVVINRTDGVDDTNWGATFELPVQGENLLDIDLNAITAFQGDRIGILWSNQNTEVMYFAVHVDDSSDTVWEPREIVLNGSPNVADDHINLAVRESDGTVLAVTKTGFGGSTNPAIYFSKRDPNTGVWSRHTAWLTNTDMTRPIVVLNSQTDSVYVFAKSANSSPLTVHYKVTHLDNPSFPAPENLGRIFIRSSSDPDANNVTSTKQTVNSATGLLVLGSDKNTKHYLHGFLDFNNKRPVAQPDAFTVNQGAATVLDVTNNDTDSDGTVDATTTFIITQPDSGTASVDPTTGALTYTPDPTFKSTDTFTYTVADDDGAFALAVVATVSINASPVAQDDLVFTNEDTPVDLSPLSNDSDPDGLVTSSLTIITPVTNGSTSFNSTSGVVTYTPNANFNGSDAFTYTVQDSSGATSSEATVTITINDVNDNPVAQDDAAATDNTAPVTIDILVNDSDTDGTLNPASVNMTLLPVGGNATVNNTTGEITYTPNANFFGTDSLKYTVQDDDGGVSNTAKVTLTVSAVPVAVNDSASTDKDVAVAIDVLANDSDPDGSLNLTSVTITTLPSNGSTSVNPITGVVTYTPATGFLGQDSFAYTVDDNSGLSSNDATVSVRVFGPPIANDDVIATSINTSVDIDILGNDTDPDGGFLVPSTVTIVLGPFNGSATLNPTNGVISYTPSNNFGGTDIIRYHVEDNDGSQSNDADVTIRVTQPPTAADDVGNTGEDSPVQIDVTANDIDLDGSIDKSTVTIATSPGNGSVTVNSSTGVVTYTPEPDFFGSDGFTYTVKDNDGLASTPASVDITVNAVNDAPVAVNDTSSTNEETPVDITLVSNDSDVDGSVIATSVTLATQPIHGSATVNPTTGVVTYTPEVDFFGQDVFNYTVNDNEGATSSIASVFVNVADVNDPPVAVNDTTTTQEEVTVDILVTNNDSDIDGTVDAATIAITVQPSNGTASVNTSTGAISYTPALDFVGTDSLKYTAQDNDGAPSNPAAVLITVTDVNDPPVAANDTVTTQEEVSVDISVTTNDTDIDGSVIATTVVIASQPASGSASVNPATGVATYVPDTDFAGTDTFTYTVADEDGATSNTATVVVQVTDVNDPPVAVDDAVTTQEDAAIEIDVSSNDTDLDGTPAPTSVTLVSQPGNGAASVDPSTGRVTYTPALDFIGSDTFEYTIRDDDNAISNPATVTVDVTAVNDAPVAVDDSGSTLEETPVDIDVTQNDTDVDGSVIASTVVIATPPANGAATVNPTTGVITYTPEVDFFGLDTLAYTVKDNENLVSNAAAVVVSVTDVNDPPVAANDTAITNQGVAVAIPVVANDTDSDGSLVFSSILSGPGANGSTSVNPATGEITYTPNPSFTGTDSFIYTINDEDGATSNTATVTVSVNNTPVAANDSTETNEETAVDIDVAANDTDANGSLDLTSVAIVTPVGNGATSVHPTTGVVTYTPTTGFSGTDSFAYTIRDDEGAASNPATVKIFVNDSPIAANDTASTNEETPVAITVTGNDTDTDGSVDASSVTIGSNPGSGSATVNPATGVITYTPTTGFSGQDSFTYTVADDKGVVSNAASVTVIVNDTPVAGNDVATTNEQTPVVIDVLINDTDSDGSLDPATVAVTSGPTSGQVAINPATGGVTYTPNSGFFGVDNFTYTVQDDQGATSNQAAVFVTVQDVNNLPVAQNDSTVTLEDSPIDINILVNDSDSDGSIDPTSVTITQPPPNGSASVHPTTGLLSYTPDPNFFGVDTLDYTVRDVEGAVSNEAFVKITVLGVNDLPVASDDTVTTNEDTPVAIPVTANDNDPDGTITTITIVGNVNNGTTSVDNSTGEVTYTPNQNFSGTDTFTYTVTDNNGGVSNVATVSINVTE